MKEKKTYNTEDFARYYSGEMPDSEMHALESAALDDPFLADALEGYQFTTTPQEDLQLVHTSLDNRLSGSRPRYAFLGTQNRWWQVAAIFILVAGAALLLLKNGRKPHAQMDSSNAIVYEQPAIPEKPGLTRDFPVENDLTPPLKENQQTLDNKPGDGNNVPKELHSPLKIERELANDDEQASGSIAADESLFESRQSNQVSPSQKQSIEPQSAVLAKGYVQRDTSTQAFVIRGRVSDEHGNPVSLARISVAGTREEVSSDESGNFALPFSDSGVVVDVAAIGHSSKRQTLKTSSENNISLETAAISNVVLVPTSKAKRSNENTKKLKPFPVNEEFNNYVDANMAPILDQNNEEVTGEVALSFTVDEYGRPKNINVLSSNCRGCESQAVNLLTTGPNWKKQKNKKGTVKIKFPRNVSTR